MAFDNEIFVGRFNRFLQRYFGMKGGPPARQLASEVMATQLLFHGVENRLLEGWRRYTIGFDLGPVVGLTVAARIFNPVGSGVITVIEQLLFLTSVADVINIRFRGGLAAGNLGAPSFANPFERRIDTFSTTQYSTDIAGSQTGQFPLALITQPNVLVNIINQEDQEIVVDPGQWIQIHTTVANTRFQSIFVTRE